MDHVVGYRAMISFSCTKDIYVTTLSRWFRCFWYLEIRGRFYVASGFDHFSMFSLVVWGVDFFVLPISCTFIFFVNNTSLTVANRKQKKNAQKIISKLGNMKKAPKKKNKELLNSLLTT